MSEDARTAPLALNIHYFIKWTLISVVIGLTVGAIGTVFGHGVAWATRGIVTIGRFFSCRQQVF